MLFLILAILAETVYFSDFEYFLSTKRSTGFCGRKKNFRNVLTESSWFFLLMEGHTVPKTENRLFGLAGRHGITILEYVDGRLVYWSDNEFDVLTSLMPAFRNLDPDSERMVFKTVRSDNELVVGLLRISYNYG